MNVLRPDMVCFNDREFEAFQVVDVAILNQNQISVRQVWLHSKE